ncbi:hypothetical protein Npun_AR283 [Leptolyngbya sp. NIES-3755]|nr:hypothetical protein Npun_AR283 [Leptolyngbya sp. NIES-3755]
MMGYRLEDTRVYREAQEDKARQIALNLLRQGLPIEAIAQATELSIAEVQTLQSQLEQES